MTGGGGNTFNTSVALPVPLTLAAVIVTLLVPVLVAVPLTSPVAVFTLNPAGKPLALKLVGVFVAAIW
jgi:hypothetical protein